MPVVLRTSEQALRTVTNALRRASYALSATSAQTVMKVIVPAAVTAIFLGMARVVGETAPLVFTAGSFNFWPEGGMGEKMPFLTYYIYTFHRRQGIREANGQGRGVCAARFCHKEVFQ